MEQKDGTPKVEDDTLRAIYSAQWSDLHHNREQDWKLFNVAAIGMFGIGALKVFDTFPDIQTWASGVFAVLSLLSIGITLRHAVLNKEKMKTIKEIETLLEAGDVYCKGDGVLNRLFEKFAKVQYFLIATYIVFFVLFLWLLTSIPKVKTNSQIDKQTSSQQTERNNFRIRI